jgi:hypothetical protein
MKLTSRDFFLKKLLPLQIIVTMMSLTVTWISQYLRVDGNPQLIGRISFRAEDPPWMPPGQQTHPVIGVHHFGDWMLDVGWAMHDNCYDLGSYACARPPLGNWILRIFGLPSPNFGFAFFIWTFLALSIYMYAVHKFLADESILAKISFFWFFIFLIPGNVISLDRGSVHFLAFGLILLSILKYVEGKEKYALLIFCCAASLKPPLLLVGLIILAERNLKKSFVVFVVPALVNLVLFLTYPGSFNKNVENFLRAGGNYVGSEQTVGNTMNAVSLVGTFSRFIEFFNGSEQTKNLLIEYGFMLAFPGLFLLLGTSLFIWYSKMHILLKLACAFGLSSLVVPSSQGYLLGWISALSFCFVLESKIIRKQSLRALFNQQITRFELCIVSGIVCAGSTLIFYWPLQINGLGRQIQFAPIITFLILLSLCVPPTRFLLRGIKKVRKQYL